MKPEYLVPDRVEWDRDSWHFVWIRGTQTLTASEGDHDQGKHVGRYAAVETAVIASYAWACGYAYALSNAAEIVRQLAGQHPWRDDR